MFAVGAVYGNWSPMAYCRVDELFDKIAMLYQEKMSVLQIAAANEVTDTRLGLPNPLSECFSCGVTDTKNCEGLALTSYKI